MLKRGGALILLVLGIAALVFPASSDARRRHRSPCGTYCRQAGGLGGSPGVPPCKVLNRVIHVNAGLATVRVNCFGRHTSRGAVVIYPHNFSRDGVNDGIPPTSYGGADLVCKPHQTVTLQIALSPKTRALLRRRHKLRVDVLVQLNTKPIVQANSWANIPMT